MFHTMQSALIFLIETLFNVYLFVLTLRLMLAFIRSNYFNPLTQFTVKLTGWLIHPLKKRIPNIGNIETASALTIFAMEWIKFCLIVYIGTGMLVLASLPILAIADMFALIVQIFTYAILIQVILSFIQPFSPFAQIAAELTAPIMHPIQRFIPPIGGLDITPFFALVALQLINIILINPLMTFGQQLVLQ